MASVFGNIDLGGDIVEPGAFTRSLQHKNGEVPILYQHDTRQPIGLGKVRETKAGLEITGELVMQASKAQEAYALMKRGVLKGLSIGFDVVHDTVANGIRHLHELKLYEVSVVTFPMNEMALVSSVKSDDPVANFRATLEACRNRFTRGVLTMVKQSVEDRLAALEIKFTEWEARRRKIIPAEIDADENVLAVMKDCLGEYHRNMKKFAGQRRLDEATTEMNRLRAEAAAELERKEKLEKAELLEAIAFYEKYRRNPPGYEFFEEIEQ